MNRCCLKLSLCLLLVLPLQAGADWHRQEAAIMGTAITVELWHTDASQGSLLTQTVMNEMQRIDNLMSTYKDDSELSAVNANAARQAVPVSSELLVLLARALEFSETTDGAFDITYASAGKFYDYRAGKKPDDDQLQAVLPAIDYRHVQINRDAGTVRFSVPGVRVDLGGIAKGYAVDRAVRLLQAAGIEHALVTAGGDTRVIGKRWNRAWNVGIRDPRNKQGVVTMVPLEDMAISTSGDYERFFIEDGVRYHHIINPGTGTSSSEVRSVSIIGQDATTTDALSTSVFVLGVDAGLQLVDTLHGIEAVIIDNQGQMHYSTGLAKLD
jgi:thiamine biosynthesis lipoprotein